MPRPGSRLGYPDEERILPFMGTRAEGLLAFQFEQEDGLRVTRLRIPKWVDNWCVALRVEERGLLAGKSVRTVAMGFTTISPSSTDRWTTSSSGVRLRIPFCAPIWQAGSWKRFSMSGKHHPSGRKRLIYDWRTEAADRGDGVMRSSATCVERRNPYRPCERAAFSSSIWKSITSFWLGR